MLMCSVKRIFLLAALISLPLTTYAGHDPDKSPTPFNTPSPNPFKSSSAAKAQPQLIPPAPNVDAAGFVLMDANSGKLIAAKNPDQRMAPASLTKMMTSYILSAALDAKRVHFDDLVPVSEAAWRTGGSKMFIKVGDKVPLRDLMQGMIVASGNDACVALAEFVAGSQDSFVNLMNQQAALLGMKNTHFMDVNGLPDANHYTTPRDMAILARALIADFPQDYQWYSQKWYTYNNIRQPNRNRLLWEDTTVDGIKTGHTDDAGFCLVASAKRNGGRLISVVMGAPSDRARAVDSQQLLTYGFRFYGSHKLYAAKSPLTQARVMFGENPEVPVGPARDIYVTLPVGQDAAVKTNVVLKNPLTAPIKRGDIVGTMKIVLNSETLAEHPMIALEDDSKGPWWQQLFDRGQLMLKKIF